MLVRARQRGVTLVELMIVVVIFATLVAAAAPNFSGFIANSQIRSASDNLRSALRVTQIEAIKRNALVELVLTDSVPTAAGVTPSIAGRNWVIRQQMLDGSFELIQGFAGAAQLPRVQLNAARGIFAFDAFGRLRADSAGNAAPAGDLQIGISDLDSSGRPLRVLVRPGGSTVSCDPSAASGAPFACS